MTQSILIGRTCAVGDTNTSRRKGKWWRSAVVVVVEMCWRQTDDDHTKVLQKKWERGGALKTKQEDSAAHACMHACDSQRMVIGWWYYIIYAKYDECSALPRRYLHTIPQLADPMRIPDLRRLRVPAVCGQPLRQQRVIRFETVTLSVPFRSWHSRYYEQNNNNNVD